jgi:hypothetical protein
MGGIPEGGVTGIGGVCARRHFKSARLQVGGVFLKKQQ